MKQPNKITKKTYLCPVCNDISEYETNHDGEIYPHCKVCDNSVLYNKERYEDRFDDSKCDRAQIVPYRFDISVEGEALMYNTLVEYLETKLKYKKWASHAPQFGKSRFHEERWNSAKRSIVRIRNKETFESQYISSIGRIHNWYEFIYPNWRIKSGYYLIHK